MLHNRGRDYSDCGTASLACARAPAEHPELYEHQGQGRKTAEVSRERAKIDEQRRRAAATSSGDEQRRRAGSTGAVRSSCESQKNAVVTKGK